MNSKLDKKISFNEKDGSLEKIPKRTPSIEQTKILLDSMPKWCDLPPDIKPVFKDAMQAIKEGRWSEWKAEWAKKNKK